MLIASSAAVNWVRHILTSLAFVQAHSVYPSPYQRNRVIAFLHSRGPINFTSRGNKSMMRKAVRIGLALLTQYFKGKSRKSEQTAEKPVKKLKCLW